MATVLTLIAAACALAYLPMTPKSATLLRSALKTASVGVLALVALYQGAPILLTAALGLCALGDALLSRETDKTFMAGIGAFAAGHIAYIVLFVTRPSADLAMILDHPGVFWSLIILGIVAASVLVPRAGDLTLPVLGYIPIILGMGVTVLALPGEGALGLALPAALAFIASDLILAAEKFVLPAGHPALRVTPYLVWPLYWGAQAGLLFAFL